jgi:polyphosphate glucokinase
MGRLAHGQQRLQAEERVSQAKGSGASSGGSEMAKQTSEKLRVLSFDIGGTGLKASVVDGSGKMLAPRVRVKTPHPSSPSKVVKELVGLAKNLPKHQCIAAGFPGVVKNNVVHTAPNLGTKAWAGFDLGKALTSRLGGPAKIINDADIAGFAVIKRKGLEMMITLGTGFGTALYRDGELMPHMEIGQSIANKNKTYDQWIGDKAFKKDGLKTWNKHVKETIAKLHTLLNYDHLFIGGGNARHIGFKLPKHVTIVSNNNGIEGGGLLWHYA